MQKSLHLENLPVKRKPFKTGNLFNGKFPKKIEGYIA